MAESIAAVFDAGRRFGLVCWWLAPGDVPTGKGPTVSVTQARPVSADGSVTGGAVGLSPRRRLSRGHWLALVLGLATALVVYVALQDRSEVVLVAVAPSAVAPGSLVTEESLRWVELPTDSVVTDEMVDQVMLAQGEWVAARPLQPGEPLTAHALARAADLEGQRTMSVPVARERAAGGQLEPGDRVDVIDVTSDGDAVFVVADAEVMAVGEEVSGSVGEAPGAWHVVLAVDAEEALALAEAMADDSLDVVRSTSAPQVVTEPGGPAVSPDADADVDANLDGAGENEGDGG